MPILNYEQNRVIVLIGFNGTGKSTITHDLIQKWRQANPLEKIILSDPQRQFAKYSILKVPTDKDWALKLSAHHPPGHPKAGHPVVCNSLIVLDDFRDLYDGNSAPQGLKSLFIDRRFHNNDIIMSVHTPEDILAMTKNYITKYYFFHTKSKPNIYRERLAYAELCMGASNMVNQYYAEYSTIIKHPLDRAYTGQGFPYIIFDTATKESVAVNMNKPLHVNGKKIF